MKFDIDICLQQCYHIDTSQRRLKYGGKHAQSYYQAGEEIRRESAPCRKLGELKNGEEATFEIGEDAVKVYVIADKLTRGYCNDYYQLEAGAEDIYLTGRNDFDLGSGNAFRFDNNANGPDETQKKKSRRTGLIVTIAAALVGAVLGYLIVSGLHSAKAAAPKTFTAEEMSITLTERR